MKKKVFISYAHHDSTPFTARLASELEHYYETFWDNKLQAGAWSPQLEAAIRLCDAFVVVMSHEREKSAACEWELNIAQDQLTKSTNQPKIIPVKAFENYADSKLTHLQYSDFARHYDEGFRDLTNTISNQRLSAWEYLGNENAETLLQHLKDGHIPGLIAMEFGDWIVVDQLWRFFLNTVLKTYTNDFPIYQRTPKGVLEATHLLINVVSFFSDSIFDSYTQEMEKILKEYNETCSKIQDKDHFASGQVAYNIYEAARRFCMNFTVGTPDTPRYTYYREGFRTDVAEKLSELITLHARRSRHLY